MFFFVINVRISFYDDSPYDRGGELKPSKSRCGANGRKSRRTRYYYYTAGSARVRLSVFATSNENTRRPVTNALAVARFSAPPTIVENPETRPRRLYRISKRPTDRVSFRRFSVGKNVRHPPTNCRPRGFRREKPPAGRNPKWSNAERPGGHGALRYTRDARKRRARETFNRRPEQLPARFRARPKK